MGNRMVSLSKHNDVIKREKADGNYEMTCDNRLSVKHPAHIGLPHLTELTGDATFLRREQRRRLKLAGGGLRVGAAFVLSGRWKKRARTRLRWSHVQIFGQQFTGALLTSALYPQKSDMVPPHPASHP